MRSHGVPKPEYEFRFHFGQSLSRHAKASGNRLAWLGTMAVRYLSQN